MPNRSKYMRISRSKDQANCNGPIRSEDATNRPIRMEQREDVGCQHCELVTWSDTEHSLDRGRARTYHLTGVGLDYSGAGTSAGVPTTRSISYVIACWWRHYCAAFSSYPVSWNVLVKIELISTVRVVICCNGSISRWSQCLDSINSGFFLSWKF